MLATQPGCPPSDYQPSKCGAYPGGSPVVLGPPDTRIRPETYYYHSDHLGSTSWVTDQDARVHEHVEYFPYGQIWRDVRSDADANGGPEQRFLFTGKELHEETGLYYFGARYEAPVRARWLSVDPDMLKDATPGARRDGQGPNGKYRAGNAGRWSVALSGYAVSNWGPVTWSDPDGRSAFWKAVRVVGAGVKPVPGE